MWGRSIDVCSAGVAKVGKRCEMLIDLGQTRRVPLLWRWRPLYALVWRLSLWKAFSVVLPRAVANQSCSISLIIGCGGVASWYGCDWAKDGGPFLTAKSSGLLQKLNCEVEGISRAFSSSSTHKGKETGARFLLQLQNMLYVA